ncbi:MAG: hypothetical protein H7336_00590 [Bacteriovorax sp.]|nr:hypothetical protein [Bacteriovorax sp.]
MKTLLILALFTSAQLFASETKPLKACGNYAAQDLMEEHVEWDHTYYMLNADQKVVGAFSVKGNEIQAQVCEYIAADNVTVANEWYYWQNTELSANPADWSVDNHYRIAQDEGSAFFQVLKTSNSGEVTIKFSVMGADEEGNDVEMRTDVLTFNKFN